MRTSRILSIGAIATFALPVFAQIDGVVMNATTEKSQGGVTINLVHPGENGMQTLATVKSGADGKFKIDQPVPPPPALLQATFEDAQYTLFLQPGAPASGLRVNVYNTTNQASEATLSQQHLLILEPSTDALKVNETFLLHNTGKVTFMDPVKGSVQFYLPKDVRGTKVTIEPPNGLGIPITRAPEKTSQDGVFKVGYPAKPGDTVYEVAYTLPPSAKFTGKALGQGQMLVVTPETVKLSGSNLKEDGVKEMGQGGARVRVYQVEAKSGASYEVSIEGTGALKTPNAEPEPTEEEGGSPKPRPGPPRLYDRLPWVLGLAFGILGLGGTLLYRRGTGPDQPVAR